MTNNNEPIDTVHTSPYMIAYLDLLGTTDKITLDDSDDYLNIVKNIYNDVIKWLKLQVTHPLLNTSSVKVRIFSDNIVAAIKCQDPTDITALRTLVSFSSEFQFIAYSNYNWLLRGGIAYGAFYMDELIVWGNGLVAALELENDQSHYPRVVIDENICKKYSSEKLESMNLLKDDDGKYFVGYLERSSIGLNSKYMCQLARHLEQQLIEVKNNSKVYNKYLWCAHYHNFVCDKSYRFGERERVHTQI